MHNVNLEALNETIRKAREDPSVVRQQAELSGEWSVEEGAPQFRGTIPYPGGELTFEADFPPPMGGTGSAPNPLAYCFWGGLACYAMTFAQEAARQGVEIRLLRAHLRTESDQTRALALSDRPPVEHIDWELDVEADGDPEKLEEIKRLADEHCPGVFCLRNPIELHTSMRAGSSGS
jgi:uncharacterized OsmC-like protein